MQNKRGQLGVGIITGLFILYVIAIIVVSAINWKTMGAGAISDAVTVVSDAITSFFKPLLNSILGLSRVPDTNNQFLMIITFILITIIIASTMDSVNLFGDNVGTYSQLVNLVIGLIVAIIGVRFMPVNMWESLTAPSSAFVATILMAIPFLALFFVTMKLKSTLAAKLMWLFFLIFTIYLIFRVESSFRWVYLIFAILAGIMMFFDSTARHFFYSEKSKYEIEKETHDLNLKHRQKIRDEIEELQKVVAGTTAPPEEKTKARRRITYLRGEYAKLRSS